MKALVLFFAMIISVSSLHASNSESNKKGKKIKSRIEMLKDAVTAQVNRHFFYPVNDGEQSVEGQADVMLQVMPQGDMQIILIQTKNPLIRKFVEQQVKKMKVDKDEVVAGEIFKYRLVFKARG